MTIAILCVAILAVGFTLCLVLAEPWQRSRYERAAATIRERIQRMRQDAKLDLDELEALIGGEMDREARDA